MPVGPRRSIECGRTAYGTLSPYGYVAETATEIDFSAVGNPGRAGGRGQRRRCSTRCKARGAWRRVGRGGVQVEWRDDRGEVHGCTRWHDDHLL